MLFGVGICPFIKFLIKGSYPEDINIYILFLIYLMDTVIGYLTFGYKRVILTVYQRIYIINFIELVVILFKNMVQIMALVFFADFYLYIIILPVTTLLSSVAINMITNKL